MADTELDETISTLIRELWPEANWTQAQRDEWRARLAPYPVERLEAALRDSYAANSTRTPRLDDVISKVKLSRVDVNNWKTNEPDMKDIEKEISAARKRLAEATPEKKRKLVDLYREKVGTDLPGELSEWKRNQVMIAAALLGTL